MYKRNITSLYVDDELYRLPALNGPQRDHLLLAMLDCFVLNTTPLHYSLQRFVAVACYFFNYPVNLIV